MVNYLNRDNPTFDWDVGFRSVARFLRKNVSFVPIEWKRPEETRLPPGFSSGKQRSFSTKQPLTGNVSVKRLSFFLCQILVFPAEQS